MRDSAGLQSVTTEWRWGVVDASEPPDVRPVRGFVTVLEHRSPADSPLVTYKLLFFDVEGRPVTAFPFEDFLLMTCAGALAMAEVDDEAAAELECDHVPTAVLVPLAT